MSASLVEIEGIEVRLGGRPVLSGVSLTLREGGSWALPQALPPYPAPAPLHSMTP